MKFTITDTTNNEILRIETLDNLIVDTATNNGDDIEVIKSDFITSVLQAGETAHEGNYPSLYYDYDGTDFIYKDEVYMPPLLRDPKQLLVLLVEQMRDSGFVLPLHKDFVLTKSDAKNLIDQAASRACERYVSPGKFTVFEYQLTQKQVEVWRLGGSIEADAPEMLKSWFEHSEYATLEDAAQNIEQTATQFNTVIQLTRRLRLEGKKAVTDAVGDFKPIMETYINQLDSL